MTRSYPPFHTKGRVLLFRSHVLAACLACAVLPGADLAAQDVSIQVIDDAAREVVLAAVPRRIVSLVPVATEILFDLGEGSRIVGRDVGDAIRPSIETVLQRRPDLVIVIGGSDNAQAVREMELLEIPFIVVLFNTLEDLRSNILRLGRIVDREDEAQEIWAGIEMDLEQVREAVAGTEPVTVYYDVGYPPAFTVGAGSYLDALLSTAGGRNVFGDLEAPSPRVSLEAIVMRDPDVIIHPSNSTEEMASARPEARPGWENLRAVRSGQVVTVPAELVHRLGPRTGEAAKRLALALHPEVRETLRP